MEGGVVVRGSHKIHGSRWACVVVAVVIRSQTIVVVLGIGFGVGRLKKLVGVSG